MFTNHVFTDECMVQLSANSRFCFCLRGDVLRRVKSTHKNPVSIMIWGGISWDGPTELILLDPSTKIDSGLYQVMLDSAYKPWARRLFGDNAVLIQDNAPCHSAHNTRAYLEREELKGKDHLIQGIYKFWEEHLTVERCRRYIRRVQSQMRKVIAVRGAPVFD
ncbi:hypothetical protein PMAYCL1PPCAC_26305 [Pristionchus mayeri]|uniref:Tc1-like transposase DDE domain-containing protein n=1 Tax=Pristionchus mayeri TaxID=1317129 RepID=A0AAN5D5K7_9BILA|nr:hypothetical protein PMAYCL1PPCAC_26305 [Pristionchus mayeri]